MEFSKVYIYGLSCRYGNFKIIACKVKKIITSDNTPAYLETTDGDTVTLNEINHQQDVDLNMLHHIQYFFFSEKIAVRFSELFREKITNEIDLEIKNYLSFREKIKSYKTDIKYC